MFDPFTLDDGFFLSPTPTASTRGAAESGGDADGEGTSSHLPSVPERLPPSPCLGPSPPRVPLRSKPKGCRGQMQQRPHLHHTSKFMLEVFAGEGSLTAACAEVGLRVACPVDILPGPEFDISDPAVQNLLVKWVRKGRFWLVHLAPPCTGWSVSRRGKQLASSLSTATFTIRMVRAARLSGTHITLENPRSSRLFTWPPLAKQFRLSQLRVVNMCYCSYGAPFKKPTVFLSSLPQLQHLQS